MNHLLDVNVLLAAIWKHHPQHSQVTTWLTGKSVVLCPLAELGYLRISSNKKVFNIPMNEARAGLETFTKERKATRIADDLPALESNPKTSDEVTDHYLADLAAKHGLRFATLDAGIKHKAVEVVR